MSALAATLFTAASAWAVTATYNGTGTPVAIPDNGSTNSTAGAAGPAAASSITDVNVTVNVTHTWASDVALSLASSNPAVAATTLIQNCGGNADYTGVDITFDDQAGAPVTCVAGTNIPGGTFQSPLGATVLAAFNGAVTAGPVSWTLTAADDSAICTGTLNSWSVTVTSADPLPVELRNFSVD